MRVNSTNLFLYLLAGCLYALAVIHHATQWTLQSCNSLLCLIRMIFNQTAHGKQVDLFILKKNKNFCVAITNYGGRIVSVLVPDKKGNPVDVVLGYDSLKSYQKPKEPYFGALIGRYGNRIAKGKFSIDGKSYQLDINDGVNTLHGGFNGFYMGC